jgi:hypothetical protein
MNADGHATSGASPVGWCSKSSRSWLLGLNEALRGVVLFTHGIATVALMLEPKGAEEDAGLA